MRKSGSVFQSLTKSTASLVEPSPNSRQNTSYIKAIERLERKNKILQDKIIDGEVDQDLLNGLLIDKEKEIYFLRAKISDIGEEKKQQEKKKNDELKFIQKVAELEAELKFKDEELYETQNNLSNSKEQRRLEVEELLEQVS